MPRVAEPLELAMVPGGGELVLRDAEEPFLLESPTTVTGTQDAGVISGATFSTPTAVFDLPVLDGALTANIEATITEVNPGSSTGTVDPDGNVSLSTSVTVDLLINVPDALIHDAHCRSTPVDLELFSVAPYDPETETVTLRDPNFSIPHLEAANPACNDTLVLPNADPMLFGPGHAVTLPLEGFIAVPDPCEVDSTTTLEITPDGGAALGEKVTMTATVASDDPGATDPVTGVVEFRSATKTLGQGTVTAGVATFETTTLALGDHDLTAAYRGDAIYCSSTDEVTGYTVNANPIFEVTVPSSVKIGETPVAFPLMLENPTVGSAISNSRLDITIQRWTPNGNSIDALDPADVLLEREGPSGVWTPVLLTALPAGTEPGVTGTIGAAGGQPLAPGANLNESLRLSFPAGSPATIPGPLTVTFEAVDPNAAPDTRPLATTSGRLTIRNEARTPTTTTVGGLDPSDVRVGGTLVKAVGVISTLLSQTVTPSGPVRMLIDGVPVPFWADNLDGPESRLEVSAVGIQAAYVNIPPSVGIGNHTITAMFLGDDLFAPSSASETFTVHEPVGTPYECFYDEPFRPGKFIVNVSAEGRVPAVAVAGASAPVEDFALSFKAGRSQTEYFTVLILLLGGLPPEITIDLGEHGEGSAVSATQTGDPWFFPDGGPIDFETTFDGEEGAITPTGAPGDVITTAIEGFTITTDLGGFLQSLDCEPTGESIVLGETVVAGATLSVEAKALPRADDEVTLRASVAPSWGSGVVEFYSGSDLVSIAAIDDGVAVVTATLAAGTHSLTARARLGASAPSSMSPPVTLEVGQAVECATFAEEGSAAVVRLVYMELLGRCPDPAGFDHWTGRLDAGTSPEAFARSIAGTSEAVGRVVDDAYEAMLGRAPDAAGRAFWIGRLKASGRYDSLLADLAGSGEFWAKAGSTNTGFVTRVYRQLLDRDPDAGGLDYWVDRLGSGTSRRALVVTLANLDEPLGRLVVASYEEILGRTPSGVERTQAIAFLRSTGDRSGLYADLIGSSEFEARAQEFPNPED